MEKYQIPPDIYEKNKELILSVETAQERCRICRGKCWQTGSMAGFMPILKINGENIYESVHICKYEQQKRDMERMSRRVRYARIPEIYRHDSFDDFRITSSNQDAIGAVRLLLKENTTGQGIFLWGPTGTGKTMLASILANEYLKLGRNVIFLSMPDFLFSMRSSLMKNGADEILQEVMDTDVLILDDFGSERITQWASEKIFMLLNHRCNNGFSTSITSNYNLDILTGRFAVEDKNGNSDSTQGYRIASRIIKMCNIVEISGEDQRLMNSISRQQTGKVINLTNTKR